VSMYPKELKYTKTHEWIRVEGTRGKCGITFYASDQLGDIVFVELPEVGQGVVKGEAFGVVESVKAVSDCYAPVSGKVVAVNEMLETQPELINQSTYDEGWIIEVELSDPSELDDLMDAQQYEKHVEEAGHH